MNTKRIEEIQKETAYPDSISVQQALLKVWNECEHEKAVKNNAGLQLVVCSNCPKVIGLTVGKSYTQLAKHKDIIALVNDYGDFKLYNIAYFE